MSSIPYCLTSTEQPLRIAARKPRAESRPSLTRAQTSPFPRPLPPIPKPASSRPLPLPPVASGSSSRSSIDSNESQISAPPQRSKRSKTALPVPPLPSKPAPRVKPPMLTVQTSPSVLRRAPSPNPSLHRRPTRRSSMTTIVTPLSASIPCPPTPHTARKRQLSKLERRLGERVPIELIQGGGRKAARLSKAQGSSDDCMMYKAAMFAKRIADDGSIVVDDGKDGKGTGLEGSVHVLSFGTATRAPSLSGRQSTHWVWDKGGSRWESSLEDVLRTLRSL